MIADSFFAAVFLGVGQLAVSDWTLGCLAAVVPRRLVLARRAAATGNRFSVALPFCDAIGKYCFRTQFLRLPLVALFLRRIFFLAGLLGTLPHVNVDGPRNIYGYF